MAQTKYKYKIAHYYSLTPRELDVVGALRKIGIPERTFYRDRSILLAASTDIPGHRLAQYAQFFNITVDQLYADGYLKSKASKAIKTGLKVAAFLLAAYMAGACASYDGLGACPTFKHTSIHNRR